MKRFIRFKDGIVVGIRWASQIVDGETESEKGEIGQKLVDGKFVDVPVEPQPPVETMEEKITRLEQQVQSDNFMILEVLAEIYAVTAGGKE